MELIIYILGEFSRDWLYLLQQQILKKKTPDYCTFKPLLNVYGKSLKLLKSKLFWTIRANCGLIKAPFK